jgi:hypothetical protein
MEPSLRSDPLVRMLGHTTVMLLLLTVAFYLLPLRFDVADAWSWGRLLTSLVALTGVAVLIRASLRRSSRKQTLGYARIQLLLTVLYVLVLGFAILHAAVAYHAPEQFVGMENRTDALYFSVTVVGTVGFGDIHAEGTGARLIVTAQMLFNLIYLGTALRVITSRRDAGGSPAERF